MEAQFYLVGGAVRDKLAGLTPKDNDYTVVAPSYAAMKEAIQGRGGEIFLEQEQFLTIRAKVPKFGACDFVLARKDGTYAKDGRRPDFVEPGTLEDDLRRRDFTVNAMAEDEQGNIVDLFGGQKDLSNKLLRCVGDTEKRMREDSLRMLRAFRFVVTKGFHLCAELTSFLGGRGGFKNCECNADLLDNISAERIREELFKCFEANTPLTLNMLNTFWQIRDACFRRNIKLVPTMFVK